MGAIWPWESDATRSSTWINTTGLGTAAAAASAKHAKQNSVPRLQQWTLWSAAVERRSTKSSATQSGSWTAMASSKPGRTRKTASKLSTLLSAAGAASAAAAAAGWSASASSPAARPATVLQPAAEHGIQRSPMGGRSAEPAMAAAAAAAGPATATADATTADVCSSGHARSSRLARSQGDHCSVYPSSMLHLLLWQRSHASVNQTLSLVFCELHRAGLGQSPSSFHQTMALLMVKPFL